MTFSYSLLRDIIGFRCDLDNADIAVTVESLARGIFARLGGLISLADFAFVFFPALFFGTGPVFVGTVRSFQQRI